MHSNAKPKAQENLISRCSGYKPKEGMLTEGGLLSYEFSEKEKLAEVIVLGATRCIKRHRFHKQGRAERKLVHNLQRNGASHSPVKAEQEEEYVKTKATALIEQVLRPQNLQKALHQVIANKGSAGIDGLQTTELKDYVQKHKSALLATVKDNNYLPQPILGVEIPKGEGKTRLLGIPAVVDRLLPLLA